MRGKKRLVDEQASDEMDYSLPAGIFSDQPESYKPTKGEKRLAKWLKIRPKVLSESVDQQKSLKGKHMGHKFVKKLLDQGMDVCVQKIFSYLNWIQLALLLAMLGAPHSNLNYLAATVARMVCLNNTRYERNQMLGKQNYFFCDANIFFNLLKNN